MPEKNDVVLTADEPDYVVLLHGITKDGQIMAELERYLKSLGYLTVNLSYDSVHYPIEELAKQVFEKIKLACTDSNKKIHFVVHSLGSLISRAIIAENSIPNLGRVVQIAPPSHGLELVDFLKKYNFYQKKFGPAGMELGRDGFAKKLPQKINFDLGIIAGNRSSLQDLFFSWFIVPRPNDGKISVESTKLEGMRDHIVLPCDHPSIPLQTITAYQTAYFLKYDKFDPSTLKSQKPE